MKLAGILVCLCVAAAVLEASVVEKETPGLQVAEEASRIATHPKPAVAAPVQKPAVTAQAEEHAVPASTANIDVVPTDVANARTKRDDQEKLYEIETEINELNKNETAHGHDKHLGHKFAPCKNKDTTTMASPTI